ncbi:trehalose receptor domain-containing protein [Phthorimaea operculella]|nr:trehalose receptor domain-containing protein [Phthorimaea operculella]
MNLKRNLKQFVHADPVPAIYLNELVKRPQQTQIIDPKNTINYGYYAVVRQALLVCRWSGLLPISGLGEHTSQNVRYSWKSLYTLQFWIVVAAHLVFVGIVLRVVGLLEANIQNYGNMYLISCMALLMVLLAPFSMRFKKTLSEVEALEKTLPPVTKTVITRINTVMYVIILTGLLKHLLYLCFEYEVTLTCAILPGDSGPYLRSFVTHTLHIKFNYTSFDYLSAAVFQIALLQSSFVWNYTDTYIIVTSMYLMYRFQEFNHTIALTVKKLPRSIGNEIMFPWSNLREYYTQLSTLVYVLDGNINAFTFVSFAKIIFIGEQIYLLINTEMTAQLYGPCANQELDRARAIYFSFASLYLLGTVSLVSYTASQVHHMSRACLDMLYIIPAHTYDRNFQRFMDQVYYSNVSLSGLRCFHVSRQMILSVLSTLLTYEIVLLQQKYCTWKSPYTIVFFAIVVLQCIHKALLYSGGVFTIDWLFVPLLSSLLVSTTILCSLLHLIVFSINWDKMIAKIESIEATFSSLPKKSVLHTNIILWTLLIEGTVFFIIYQGHKYETAIFCNQYPGDSGLYIKSFMMKDLRSIFKIIPFNYFYALIFQIAKIHNSFIWTINDVIVINICYYLVVRFNNFNEILKQKELELVEKNTMYTSTTWHDIQKHYTQLMKLVRILDRNIHPMVFFSCFNLVFIGKQVYFALNIEILKLFYYVFAAVTMVIRVFLVISVASRVNTLSRKPLEKLYSCPDFAYDKSFERFIDQVFHSNVSLSGFQCFYITKSTILSMLSTLVTYELLLLQNLRVDKNYIK